MMNRTSSYRVKGGENIENKRKSQRGFTLVEAIVVVMIILILSGGLVIGINTWINWSNFKKQNEYAKDIFSAVQNQLTDYSASGQLEELATIVEKTGNSMDTVGTTDEGGNSIDALAVNHNLLINSSGNYYNIAELWPESNKNNADIYRSKIYYIVATSDDYKKYRNNENDTTVADNVKALYKLLEQYLYDSSILDATICLEFTPSDGQVLAILYSSNNYQGRGRFATGFEYNNGNESLTGTVNITNRTANYRQKRMVGYYGVDELYKATTVKAQKAEIRDVKLNNENTLNLTYRIAKVEDAIKQMVYSISVYDNNDTNNPLLTIQLDGRNLDNKEATKEPITCQVTRYNTDGTTSKGEYPLLAWIESEQTIRVILDAVDLSATSMSYNNAWDELSASSLIGAGGEDYLVFKNSYSFHRFGIQTDNKIICKVQGAGTGYQSTAPSSSNPEYVYFGSVSKTGTNPDRIVTYSLNNIRHLYNVRYVEEDEKTGWYDSDTNVYQLNTNLSWIAFINAQDLYDTKNLYNYEHLYVGKNGSAVSKEQESNKTIYFPSLKLLKSASTFEATGDYRISNLSISQEANVISAIYGTTLDADNVIQNVSKGPVGLFVKNNGELKDFTLDQISVKGSDKVGAFCGENEGLLQNLITKNTNSSSQIEGDTNVGGIVGYESGSKSSDVVYDKLVNYASVTGTTYVGGIVGQLQVENTASYKIKVSNCQNLGAIEATKNSTDKEKAKFIGGIAGFCNNESSNKENLVLENSSSSPRYEVDTITKLLQNTDEAKQQLKEKLNGVYVGGIVGYSKNSKINNCNTKKVQNQEGYVFGYKYVGGIVGYNESSAQNLYVDGSTGVNEANVIGGSYVGGICGCNAALEEGQIVSVTTVIVPNTQYNEEKIIENWINKGVIAATGDYVGGITGMNAGVLKNCNSQVASNTMAQKITEAKSLNGDYAGGIAGYNNGRITSGSDLITIKAICLISGKNYVGGIVGYNDIDAKIENYELSGGYIEATGSFVGGYVGLNASQALLSGSTINSNPNTVSGQYCVGGTIGGNVIGDFFDDTTKATEINTEFNTNNFLGNITGTAFVGGFIGYNRLLDFRSSEDSDNREEIEELVKGLLEELEDDTQKDLTELVTYFSDFDNNNVVDSENNTVKYNFKSTENIKLTIQGKEGINIQSKFGVITADIYVGGVVGYNAENTQLVVNDAVNLTPVTAKKAIVNEKEQGTKKTYNDDKFSYSYAGGIIGKVSGTVTLDNCKNEDVGDVTTKGTYLGGICEINEGTIKNCSASSIGIGEKDYIGGIAGLNKQSGIIENCDLSGKTITGRNYLGGIVAENYGTIADSTIVNAKFNALGEVGYVGGVVGYNYNTAEIVISENNTQGILVTSIDELLSINSNGNYVGGIIGRNEGTINISNDAQLSISGLVSGNQNVGGIVGSTENENDVLQNFTNSAVITAVNGNAGGIAGISSASIKNCVNNGSVSATKSGDAGGIVALNSKQVSECEDQAVVSAANGDCGGIVAVNKGNISNCEIKAQITFSGRENVGGIAGINNGTIEESTVKNITTINMVDSSSSNIGILVGTSEADSSAILQNCTINNSNAFSYTSGSNIGGIAGINGINSTINNITVNNDLDSQEEGIKFYNSSGVYANMGGASGQNLGNITNCVIQTNVIGNMGIDNMGYGGITGVNSNLIQNCTYNGSVLTEGSSNAIVNVGGIAGINKPNGIVSSSIVGTDNINIAITSGYISGSTKNSAAGYVGGIVGWNYGTVQNCDNASQSNAKVSVVNYAGHTGGIVGYQMAGAVVTGSSAQEILSTGKKWSVTSNFYSNDCGTGGIIGYSASGMNMSYISNYANVSTTTGASNVTAGGMVGRLENKESDFCVINEFRNYGTVTSILAGGALGRLKYKGITIQNSENYGNISSSGESAAGFIGSFYYVENGSSIIFDTCKNFGEIKGGSYAAGISGSLNSLANSSNSIKLICTNSVNEGVINGNNCAGISSNTNGQQKSYFYRCRNYGNSSKSGFAGITISTYQAMEDCISLGNTKQLATGGNKSNIVSSYYLGEGELPEPDPEDESRVYLSTVENNATASSREQKRLYEKALESRDIDHDRYAFESTKNPKTVKFNFNTLNGYALTNFGIYFANNGATGVVRKYTFKIACNSQDLYLTKDGSWGTEEQAYEFTSYGTDSPTTSYWSTGLNGNTNIKNITLIVSSVENGSFVDGKFQKDKNTPTSNYVCLYAITASTETGKNYTSTATQVYAAEATLTTANNELETAKSNLEDFENGDEYKKAKEELDSAEAAYNNDFNLNNGAIISTNYSNTPAISTLLTDEWKRVVIGHGKDTVITLTLDNKVVDKLQICWAGNAETGGVKRDYNYDIILNENNTLIVSNNATGQPYTEETADYKEYSLINQGNISKIQIKINSVYNQGTTSQVGYTCLWKINILGKVSSEIQDRYNNAKEVYAQFEEEYQSLQETVNEKQIAVDNAQVAIENSYYWNGTPSNAGICGLKPSSSDSETTTGDSTYGTKATSGIESGKTTYAIGGNGAISHSAFLLTELTNNPTSLWTDDTAYIISGDESSWKARQKVYEEVDPKILEYYKTGSTTPSAIINLETQSSGGSIQVTWKHNGKDYYEDQLVYIIDNGDDTFVEEIDNPIVIAYGVESYSLQISPKYYGKTIGIYVRSISGGYQDAVYKENIEIYGPQGTETQENTSQWVNSSIEMKEAEAAPRIHFELAAYDSDSKTDYTNYVAVLENPEDYQKEGRATTIKIDLNGTKIEFNTGDKRSKKFSMSVNDNIVITTYAAGNDNYAESIHSMVQTAFYGGNYLKNTDYVTTDFKDFYGDTFSNLYNQVQMKNAITKTELYMNVELVAENYSFGDVGNYDLVVSSGVSHVTQNGGTMTSNLSNLPEDLLNYNMLVRTYPWRNQAYVCWYARTITSEPINKETLIGYMENGGLLDVERGSTEVFDKDQSALNAGYVIRLVGENQYEILYSAILANYAEYAKQIDSKEYIVENQTVTSEDYSKKIQDTPVIETSNPLQQDGNSYKFVWDKEKADNSAKYDLQLKGIASDNSEVILGEVTVDKSTKDANGDGCYYSEDGGYWTYTFVDNDNIWNYSKLKLEVVRRGTVDGKGLTSIFPSAAQHTFDISLRFSQISRPTVALHQENGSVEKNSLKYDITWNCVPSKERAFVEFYEVLVEPSENDTKKTDSYDDKTSYEEALERIKILYQNKIGCESKEGDEQITYTWNESLQTGTDDKVNKTVILSWNSTNYTITRNITEKWLFAPQDNNAETMKEVLNLDDYNRGELIDISVRATTSVEKGMYRDGVKGVVRQITLPERLVVPSVGKLESTPMYLEHAEGTYDTYMTREDFEIKGITLNLSDTNVDSSVHGRYEIAIAVFENSEEEDYSKRNTGDAPDELATGYWNSGALETVIKKQDTVVMTGDLEEASFILQDLSAQYAGKWVKVALRAVSDSQVSSWWTDEDEEADYTLNYKWIHLPRVQLETPDFKESGANVYYNLVDGSHSLVASSDPDEVPVQQSNLSFELQDYTNGYCIQRVRAEEQVSLPDKQVNYSQYEVDWIYLEKIGDGYAVFYNTTDSELLAKLEKKNENIETISSVCKQNEDAIYLGSIRQGEALELPFSENATITEDQMQQIQTVSYLRWIHADDSIEGSKDSFAIILPDVEEADGYVPNNTLFTAQMTVRAMALEEITRYEDSMISNWYRYIENEAWTTKINTFQDYASVEENLSYKLLTSDYKSIAYQIETTAFHHLVYEINVLENKPADGETPIVLATDYVSTLATGNSNLEIITLLRDDFYAQYSKHGEYEGKYISIRVADILESQGGISKWSDAVIYAEPLGELNLKAPEVQAPYSTTMDANLDGELKTGIAKANEYTWRYQESSDVKVAGYEIVIGENNQNKINILYENGQWKWQLNGGEYNILLESQEVLSMSNEQKTTIISGDLTEEVWYELAVGVLLKANMNTIDNIVEFKLVLPNKTVSVQIDDATLLDFVFDSSLTLSATPINKYYSAYAYTDSSDY